MGLSNTQWIVAICLSCALATIAASAAPGPTTTPADLANDDWLTTPDGQYVYHAFASAPYPHSSRAQGYSKKTGHDVMLYSVEDHYSDSTVGIFIPTTFKQTSATNFVVHFHGWNHRVPKVFEEYKLAPELVASKVNAILLVPQLPRDAPDSGGGKLELDQNGLRNLLTDVISYLQTQNKITSPEIGKVAITAHSGGYKTAAAVLHLGGLKDHITDCLLFDSSYGSLEYFTEWAAASPSHRLVSFFTKHLQSANEELMGLLDKAHVPYKKLTEADLAPDGAALAPRGVYFIPTTLAHDEVVSKNHYFSLTLSTSALAHDSP